MGGGIFKIISVLIIVLFLQNDSTSYGAPRNAGRQLVYYSLPDKRPLKKSLGFIEDTYLNFTELTNKYGFPTETHHVITDDGYILTVFRILPKCDGRKRGFPVVMMHGIFDTSDEWIITGPDTALGYALAKNCYDVWVANHRGNFYSRRHITLNPNTDVKFWDYSFEEHGYYDVPAIIDHVLKATQEPKVNYIGHSQGTTDFFVMSSLRQDYNQKIHLSFHLAPVAWMGHIKSPLPKLLAPFSRQARTFLDNLGFRELFAKHQLSHLLVEFLCQYAPAEICGTGFTISTGYKPGNISPKNLAIAFGHLLAGVSSKDLDHFGQLIATGRFQRYDYGRKENKRRYGSSIPPEYDVSKITSAVVLINAQSDWLSSLEDIRILASKLPNLLENYVVPDPSWSHNDQVYGVNAPELVFSKILDILNRFSST